MKKIIDNIIYILTAILLTTIVLLKDKYFIMLCLAAGGLIIIGILLFIATNKEKMVQMSYKTIKSWKLYDKHHKKED